jgi:hypothetical protein
MTYIIRLATSTEAPIIAQQRRGMFRDMGGSSLRYLYESLGFQQTNEMRLTLL